MDKKIQHNEYKKGSTKQAKEILAVSNTHVNKLSIIEDISEGVKISEVHAQS